MPEAAVPDDAALAALVSQLAEHLRASQRRLATAESCTGGWIGKELTDLAGSSDWYLGGIISYSNQAKHDLLGVPTQVLAQHGAVSEQAVLAMAVGARRHLRADIAVAVSGVAGPGGGTPARPVGTVWVAWATESVVSAEQFRFPGDREAVRRATIGTALEGLIAL